MQDQITETALQETTRPLSNDMTAASAAIDPYADTKAASAAAAAAEETRTNEELDTEVSQINTQSNNKTQTSEPAESYSRPMSRTSSMTPVIKNIYFCFISYSSITFKLL